MGFWADEPRALPWAGMNDALGVSAPPHFPTTLVRSLPPKNPVLRPILRADLGAIGHCPRSADFSRLSALEDHTVFGESRKP